MKRKYLIALIAGTAVLLGGSCLWYLLPAIPPSPNTDPYHSTAPPPLFKIGQCVQFKEGSAFQNWVDEDGTKYRKLAISDYTPLKGTYEYAVTNGASEWSVYEVGIEPCD